ncbi:hypothetical protein PR003_g10578 [Phytophthora rubi]|uniref:Uncharacterized protein n=1 Tax=Phytophthora rubi TaxID=129364 RepID=A0A6A4F5A7_9STRA|nr:hypothetical protein PR003_g10578 [Phytophthora rubi]
MQVNAEFVGAVYDSAKAHDVYPTSSVRPLPSSWTCASHCQTEGLIQTRAGLELLRLGPYSPLCNPIGGRTVYLVSFGTTTS